MHIRDVLAEDAPAIQQINREALGYEFPLPGTQAQLERIIKAPNVLLLVAVDGADVLGYIQLSDYENTYHHPLKNLITLAISPRHQRRGAGKALLAAGEEWARADGAFGVRLVTGANRVHAREFYAANGYTVRKEQTNLIKWW
ncbi:GNAT family N-acetyltransferase [Lentzea flaviverrucosa]|uniref:Ribosomal protein S18 acetylase RimI n=1 Tax=Lentzea flaviverrucosa TaxID=200379 RepID=A0A1H9T2N2_9PSEU|nr:GNAT family N-acetyltransferase [Lentzea flaviverrucosa]RDI25603.1 ribosomal protein S18 acetylase RimI-like enzyme [Lentzea flaviverrucosa]SER90863.1 Ribosomal protein S18 acetylase RimI [Lentzea flaviverrucosa]